MHKALAGKNLRGRPAPRSGLSACVHAQAGFSLVELVVSIGILALMVSLAGEVMSLTVRSTGQAKALTEVNQVLRGFEQTLREDLANVPIGESLLLIQGNPINAYKTAAQREANQLPLPEDLPRADILMFFTNRRGAASYIDPEVRADVQQVVYGHAELGTYVLDLGPPRDYAFVPLAGAPPATMFPPDPLDARIISPVPAENWHLARRSVLLLPTSEPIPIAPGWLKYSPDPVVLDKRLNAPMVLRGEQDIVAEFNYEENVLTPRPIADPGTPGGWPWYWPPIFDAVGPTQWGEPFARSRLDPSPPPQVADRLGHYFLPNCASFKVEWTLDPKSEFVGDRLDGEKEVYWFDPGALAPASLGNPPEPNPLKSIREALTEATARCDVDVMACDRAKALRELLNDPLGGYRADPSERYSLASRFGLDSPLPPALNPAPSNWHRHPYGDGLPDINVRPNLVVFAANRRKPPTAPGVPGEIVPEDVFPSALRITVEVYDKARRLQQPIRHVMIIPVGG